MWGFLISSIEEGFELTRTQGCRNENVVGTAWQPMEARGWKSVSIIRSRCFREIVLTTRHIQKKKARTQPVQLNRRDLESGSGVEELESDQERFRNNDERSKERRRYMKVTSVRQLTSC